MLCEKVRINEITRQKLTGTANRVFDRHSKAVYDLLAVRQLAEQLETLYWETSAPHVAADIDKWYDEGTIKTDEDLTDDKYERSEV
jgi:hypothetical protein